MIPTRKVAAMQGSLADTSIIMTALCASACLAWVATLDDDGLGFFHEGVICIPDAIYICLHTYVRGHVCPPRNPTRSMIAALSVGGGGRTNQYVCPSRPTCIHIGRSAVQQALLGTARAGPHDQDQDSDHIRPGPGQAAPGAPYCFRPPLFLIMRRRDATPIGKAPITAAQTSECHI